MSIFQQSSTSATKNMMGVVLRRQKACVTSDDIFMWCHKLSLKFKKGRSFIIWRALRTVIQSCLSAFLLRSALFLVHRNSHVDHNFHCRLRLYEVHKRYLPSPVKLCTIAVQSSRSNQALIDPTFSDSQRYFKIRYLLLVNRITVDRCRFSFFCNLQTTDYYCQVWRNEKFWPRAITDFCYVILRPSKTL